MDELPNLEFSVSATSREQRVHEVHGTDYYFMTVNEFHDLIDRGEFLEWEEVYPNQFYGTLRKEIKRVWAMGKHVIFDVDVVGGLNLKKKFGSKAISIFIKPPSFEILKERLTNRATEDEQKVKVRLDKAAMEMTRLDEFDAVVVNDDLDAAVQECYAHILDFTE